MLRGLVSAIICLWHIEKAVLILQKRQDYPIIFGIAGIHRWVNAMVFGDIAYTANFGNQSLTLTGQVSYTSMADRPYMYGEIKKSYRTIWWK